MLKSADIDFTHIGQLLTFFLWKLTYYTKHTTQISKQEQIMHIGRKNGAKTNLPK